MAITINGTTGVSGVDGSASTPALQGSDTNTGVSFGTDTVNINTGGTTKASIDSAGALDVPSGFPIKVNGSEKVRITAAGNVGIGRSDPDQKLVVTGSGTTIFKVENTDDGTAQITLGNTGSSNLGIQQVNGATIFQEGGTERMRIDSSGNVLVGTTSSAPAQSGSTTGIALTNFGRAEIDAGANISVVVNRTNSGDIVQYRRNNLVKGEININASRVAYQTTSDYRLKENVTTLSNGITRLKTLKPSRFNFKEDPSNTMDGFIAHELQTVIPEAVSGTKDEIDSEGEPKYQGVDTSFVVPLLTAALQEAISKIEVLETKVAALEGG